MLVSRTISQVQIGGNGADNPSPFGDHNFDFDSNQAQLTYSNINVIVFPNTLHQNLQVTGKVVVIAGRPQTGPNDLVYLPCPEFSDSND